MISKKLRQVMAASMAVVMTVGLAACGEKAPATTDPTKAPEATKAPATQETQKPADDKKDEPAPTEAPAQDPNYTEEGYFIRRDASGEIVNLGGANIVVRDWWSPEDWPGEPSNAYETAQQDYLAWAQETYNFTITRQTIGDWGSNPQDFIDYCTTGGDDNYYVFTLRADPGINTAMMSGLVCDLSSLDGAINLNDEKWNKTRVHQLYNFKGKSYAVAPGVPECRGIIFFNKRLLTEAGIDWKELYAKESDPTWWTWDKFKELLAKCTYDKDNDGTNDVYGIAANWGNMYTGLIYANGGSYVDLQDGKLVNNLESKATLEALNYGWEIRKQFAYEQPADGTWEYYKDAFNNGVYAFLPDDAYYGANLKAGCNDEWGAVCYPTGPSANGRFIGAVADNLYAIPGCYSADKAWKCAFAYDIMCDEVPGFEDFETWQSQYEKNFDDIEAIDVSIRAAISDASVQYVSLVTGISVGSDLSWYGFSDDNTPAQVAESIREKWNAAIDEFNNQ
ncbi:MAG: extracellular solute-binding protein [Lachnospiraceae bacterium]|nr:extracellular solute-binding protein [Lachnospiraceae bacterium]